MRPRTGLAIALLVLSATPFAALGNHRDEWQQPEPSGPPVIAFPVEGGAVFSDDYGDPRSGGRTHEGNDLKAPKMTPVVAAFSGRVGWAPAVEPSYGYIISLRGDDGYEYRYLHLNDDTPGTDDGNGGPQHAYAPGIEGGAQVVKGQHIGWVGDSGNAEATVPHLHFEIRNNGTPLNPYPYLLAALEIYTYDRAGATAASPTINSDKGLAVIDGVALYCVPGSLIRAKLTPAVYYCGSDGKRYVFPNDKIYFSWYKDFSSVQTITPEELAMIKIGGNVTYRPGVKLVKITTDPKVYAVDRAGMLRWMTTPAIAASHYGASWSKNVEDIPDAYFINYRIGKPVTSL
jgi:hypothetical protein